MISSVVVVARERRANLWRVFNILITESVLLCLHIRSLSAPGVESAVSETFPQLQFSGVKMRWARPCSHLQVVEVTMGIVESNVVRFYETYVVSSAVSRLS